MSIALKRYEAGTGLKRFLVKRERDLCYSQKKEHPSTLHEMVNSLHMGGFYFVVQRMLFWDTRQGVNT